MAVLQKIKEKLSKENPVETNSTSEMFTSNAYSFEVDIHEEDLKDVLRRMASNHNKKKPENEISISDVFNVIVKKALLEQKLFYEDVKTYSTLTKEVESLVLTNYKVNYFMKNYLTKMEEQENLKKDFEAIKKIVNKEE